MPDEMQLPPADVTPQQLYLLLHTVRAEMTRDSERHTEELSKVVDRLAKIEGDYADLLAAWRTSAGVVRFAKVLAIMAGAVGATIAVARELFR